MNEKYILVLNGSPKNEKSCTLQATKAFLKGISESIPCKIEVISLSSLHILPCQGCLSCWGKTEGKCIIQNDDIENVKQKIEKCDLFIESFPLHFFGMPGTLKVFTDRMMSMLCTYKGQTPPRDGTSFHGIRNPHSNRKLMIISSCAYSQAEEVYEPLLKQYDFICGRNNYQAILCPQLKTLLELGPNARFERYFKRLEDAGKEFSTNWFLSEETLKNLSLPPFSNSTYQLFLNNFWEGEKNHE